MKQIRLLTVSFTTEISSSEISAFRGAMASKVGLEHDWFHNHDNSESAKSGFYYRYPLIQYKRHRGKPMLVCLHDGVDEAHKFFAKSTWDLNINGKKLSIGIEQLRLHQFNLQLKESNFKYRIRNWQALNQKNYKEYCSLSTEDEKKEYLQRKLIGNILSFAKGIGWHIEDSVNLTIRSVSTHTVRYKDLKTIAFNVEFDTNVFLPNYIGLGKGVSKGYGVVTVRR